MTDMTQAPNKSIEEKVDMLCLNIPHTDLSQVSSLKSFPSHYSIRIGLTV